MYSCTKSSLNLLLFTFKIPELSNDILACQCGHLSEAKIKSQDWPKSFVDFPSPEILLDRLGFNVNFKP